MKYSISLIALFVAGSIAIPAATTPKCKAVSISLLDFVPVF